VSLFAHEAGGHRWQRVPPNDKRGRIHTSTVTVAVFAGGEDAERGVDLGALRWETFRGSGKGGQHRNKNETGVRVTHLPTGTTVRIESGRSQKQNRREALAALQARLKHALRERTKAKRDRARKEMVGTGMRADKIRTVREQDGRVSDHRTERAIRFRDYARGNWGDLLEGLE